MVLINSNDTLHIGFSIKPLLLLQIYNMKYLRGFLQYLQKEEISKNLVFI